MKRRMFYWVTTACLSLCAFNACYTEDVVDNYFTFTGELIGDYIENRPELFSEYERMLDTTGVMGLLKAHGLYTCFVPTNNAIQLYYKSQYREKLSDFSLEEIKNFCYNHILKGDTIASINFSTGALGTMNMNARYVSVSYSDTTATIFINGTAPIIQADVPLHNGFVHVLGRAMEPSEDRVSSMLMKDERFSLFAQAFDLTGYKALIDNALIEDDTYDPDNYALSGYTHTVLEELPAYRKFGYTILAESDSTLAVYGITDMASLYDFAKEKYNWGRFANADDVADDYTNPRNYLNRYIAYHITDRTLLTSRFIKDYDTPHMFKQYDMYEYIPTLLDNTLLEVKLDRDYNLGKATLGLINCAAKMDASTGLETEDPVTGVLFTDYVNKPDGGALNGYYHEIDRPLAYTKSFEVFLSSKRLRIEGCCCFREVATNNMRGNNPEATPSVVGKTHAYQIPYNYFENLKSTEGTLFTYIGAATCYEDFQGDEIFARQQYNFTIKTLPVPTGTYEVRVGYQPTAGRGIAQLYWDSIPAGIPVNFSYDADDPSIGHEVPRTNMDDPDGYENDKMMRNRHYMKGPDSYYAPNKMYSYNGINARYSTRSLRYILGTFHFDESLGPQPHYLTVVFLGSTSGSTQFMLDYIEFCPTTLIQTEDTH